jgi:hypothetical protein
MLHLRLILRPAGSSFPQAGTDTVASGSGFEISNSKSHNPYNPNSLLESKNLSGVGLVAVNRKAQDLSRPPNPFQAQNSHKPNFFSAQAAPQPSLAPKPLLMLILYTTPAFQIRPAGILWVGGSGRRNRLRPWRIAYRSSV